MTDRNEEIEKNNALVYAIFDKVVISDRKEAIKAMLEDDDFGALFFTAPASSKEEYHYAWPGGLVSHSLNVYKNLKKLNKAFDCGFSEEEMFVAGFFHDLGKACDTTIKNPHYVPTKEAWKLKKGWLYEFSDEGVYMTNHLRSLYVFQHFGIRLTAAEYMSIYLNDGQYIESAKPYALKECPLALMVHMADRLALESERED